MSIAAPELFRLLAGTKRRLFQASIGGPPAASPSSGPVRAEKYPADAGAFFLVGEKMRLSARRRGQALAMLVLQLSDLPELELLFGRRAAEEIVDSEMAALTRVSATRGFAARTAADTFALLMPATTGEDLLGVLQARAGRTCAIELDLNGQELLLVPDVQSRTLLANQSVSEAYQLICKALDSERTLERRRRDYLREEREAHTVPIALAAGSAAQARRNYPPQPPTIPLGLSPVGGRM